MPTSSHTIEKEAENTSKIEDKFLCIKRIKKILIASTIVTNIHGIYLPWNKLFLI